MKMNETMLKAYLAEAIRQELNEGNLNEGIGRGVLNLLKNLFKRGGENAKEGILRRYGKNLFGNNVRAAKKNAENTLRNTAIDFEKKTGTRPNGHITAEQVQEKIDELMSQINDKKAKIANKETARNSIKAGRKSKQQITTLDKEIETLTKEKNELDRLRNELIDLRTQIENAGIDVTNAQKATKKALIGTGAGLGTAGGYFLANSLYDKIQQNNAHKDAANMVRNGKNQGTGSSTMTPASSDDEAALNLLKEDRFNRNIRRANSDNAKKIERAKQYFLNTFGYIWDDTKDYKENINNAKTIKAYFEKYGYRNYDAYLKANPGAVDKRKAIKHDGQNGTPTPQQDETPQQDSVQEVKKYDPSKPAPFYNQKLKVMQFQTWFNDFNEKNGYGATKPLVVDGIWGQYTQDAWRRWLEKEGRAAAAAPTA